MRIIFYQNIPLLGKKSKTKSQVQIRMESFKGDPHPKKDGKLQLKKSLITSQKAVGKRLSNKRRKKAEDGMLKRSE